MKESYLIPIVVLFLCAGQRLLADGPTIQVFSAEQEDVSLFEKKLSERANQLPQERKGQQQARSALVITESQSERAADAQRPVKAKPQKVARETKELADKLDTKAKLKQKPRPKPAPAPLIGK